ncbi:hypothetical protein C8Q76DRAFT_700708 [Earliella scabrosa]|nr:hypothetical protein C8Q76DRAFT_700708 [Earliella scabrosa]
MDTSAKKILENVAIKTLHAQGFSRTSVQTNAVLTDLLSRYLQTVAATAAKYAEHAGRRRIMVRDAVEAFDELGTSVDELKDYCATEGRDMARYATQTTKRVEDLNEFKVQLAVGLTHDDDDLIPLEWGLVPDPLPSEEEDESEYDEVKTPSDEMAKADVMMVDTEDADAEGEDDIPIKDDILTKHPLPRRPPTPPLPLSPVSNASPPPRKRQRTASWQPPAYVPDWLPPFPSDEPTRPASPLPAGAPTPQNDHATANSAVKLERPVTPPLQAQVSTASSSADYHTVVPYNESSLANVPVRHLPRRPSADDLPPPKAGVQLSSTQHSFLEAYHHILTHPPPPRSSSVNPGRYRVGLVLARQWEKDNRWDAPTTLYGGPAPNPTRVATMPPTYAIPIGKAPGTNSGAGTPDGSGKEKGEKEEEKRTLPHGAYYKHIAPQETIAPVLSRPGSRIPALARDVLSHSVYTRAARVTNPPVLQRGSQKLTYGPGVNAPWNSAFSSAPAATPAPGKGKEKDGVNGMPNGKDKDKEKETPRSLPDARLYATWNYEQKRYDEPLVVRRRLGSVAAVPMGRARSESTNA